MPLIQIFLFHVLLLLHCFKVIAFRKCNEPAPVRQHGFTVVNGRSSSSLQLVFFAMCLILHLQMTSIRSCGDSTKPRLMTR
ncbi:unnamed protein product [Amoebophrya sp. A120]|nr:unnamed protein product [Amoebophrya sp. A120]|eukprot:GSA120T00023059001.1